MIDVINLAARRADKTNDCRDWSAMDALRELLGQVERGELAIAKIYIATQCANPDGTVSYIYKCAGATKLELKGLLYTHLQVIGDA